MAWSELPDWVTDVDFVIASPHVKKRNHTKRCRSLELRRVYNTTRGCIVPRWTKSPRVFVHLLYLKRQKAEDTWGKSFNGALPLFVSTRYVSVRYARHKVLCKHSLRG